MMNRKQFYVKHQVHPDGADVATRTILKRIQSKLYIYIPFTVTHYIFDNDTIRKGWKRNATIFYCRKEKIYS